MTPAPAFGEVPVNGGGGVYGLEIFNPGGAVTDASVTIPLGEGFYWDQAAINAYANTGSDWDYDLQVEWSDCIQSQCSTLTIKFPFINANQVLPFDLPFKTLNTNGAQMGEVMSPPKAAVTDGSGSREVTADEGVTIVGTPRPALSKGVAQNGNVGTKLVDFGDGKGPVMATAFRSTVTVGGSWDALGGYAPNLVQPLTVSDTWTLTPSGPIVHEVECVRYDATACDSATNAAFKNNVTLNMDTSPGTITFDGFKVDGQPLLPAGKQNTQVQILHWVPVETEHNQVPQDTTFRNDAESVNWKEVGGGALTSVKGGGQQTKVAYVPPPTATPTYYAGGWKKWSMQFMDQENIPAVIPSSPATMNSGFDGLWPIGSCNSNLLTTATYGSWSQSDWASSQSCVGDRPKWTPGSHYVSALVYSPPSEIDADKTYVKRFGVPTKPVLYDFWDPTEQQIIPTTSIWASAGTNVPLTGVLDNPNVTILEDPTLFDIQYGSGTNCAAAQEDAQDPQNSLNWEPSIAAAGGVQKVCGVRVQFLGDQSYLGTENPYQTSQPTNLVNARNSAFVVGIPFELVAPASANEPFEPWVYDYMAGTDGDGSALVGGGTPNDPTYRTNGTGSAVAFVHPAQYYLKNAVPSYNASTNPYNNAQAIGGQTSNYKLTPGWAQYPGPNNHYESTDLVYTVRVPGPVSGVTVPSDPDGWYSTVTGDNIGGYTIVWRQNAPATVPAVFETDGTVVPNGLPEFYFDVTYGYTSKNSQITTVLTDGVHTNMNGTTKLVGANINVNVSQPVSYSVGKSVNGAAEVAPGQAVSWELSWYAGSAADRTDIVLTDVLPHVGDGRGTTTGGKLINAMISGTGQAAQGSIWYQATASSDWAELPSSAEEIATLDNVYALQARVPLAPKGQGASLIIVMQPDSEEDGRVLVNDASYSKDGTAFDTKDAAVTIKEPLVPQISVEKAGKLVDDGAPLPGDLVKWTITVENKGNTDLTSLGLTDPMLEDVDVTWDPANAATNGIPKGGSATATAYTVLTQADIDAGVVTNEALVKAGSLVGFTEDSDEASVPLLRAAQIEINKTGAPIAGSAVGDQVQWTITVTNTGNVALTNLEVTDSLPGLSSLAWDDSSLLVSLPPRGTVTATATSVLTQEQVDAGEVQNTASVTANSVEGEQSDSDTGTAMLDGVGNLTVVKSGELLGQSKVGDEIQWTIEVASTGEATVTDVQVEDLLSGLSDWSWDGGSAPTSMAPGVTAKATATYLITQADIDAGTVKNHVEVTGQSLGKDVGDTDDAEVDLLQDPKVKITKSGELQGTSAAGGLVTWTITIENQGNLAIASLDVTDALLDVGALEWPGGQAPTVLDPGEKVTATASYTITQADVNTGKAVNTAQVSGQTVLGEVADEVTAEVPLAPTGDIVVTKTGELNGTGIAGDTITWTIHVHNGSNLTLNQVEVQDDMEGLSDLVWDDESKLASLEPFDIATATATYTVTQEDVDRGSVMNEALVSALDPFGEPHLDSDNFTVELEPDPGITIKKTGALPGDTDAPHAGDLVEWSFELTNTGNVTLTDMQVEDVMPGLSIINWDGGLPDSLEPLGTVTGTATSTLTQDQIESGTAANTVSVSAKTPGGDWVDDEDTAPVSLNRVAQVEIAKSGALDGKAIAGETITWSVTVTNTGNVALTDVEVADLLGGEALELDWAGADLSTLAPNDSVSATATSTLTQDDVDAGAVTNTATVTANSVAGEARDETDATVDLPSGAGIQLVKTGQLTGVDGQAPREGDEVTWTFTVTNTGNVTLSDIKLSDELEGLSSLAWDDESKLGALGPGANVKASATSSLTQAQIDAGLVENDATVQATASDETVDGSSRAQVELLSVPVILIEKSGVLEGDANAANVGDKVLWSFRLENTGNVTLTGTQITESMPDLVLKWDGDIDRLAPGDVREATATYAVTQADLDAGLVENTVSVIANATSTSDDSTDLQTARAERVVADATTATVTLVAAKPGSTPGGGGSLAVTGVAIGGILLVGGALLVVGSALTRRKKEESYRAKH